MLVFADTDQRLVQLKAEITMPVVLISLTFSDSVSSHITDSARNLTVGGTTYESENRLIGITTPESKSEGTIASGDIYSLQFANNDRHYQQRFLQNGYTGVSLVVKVCFMYETSTGEENITDAIDAYTGKCSSVSLTTDNDEIIFTASFTGPLAKVDNEYSVVATPDNQKRRDPTDTCFNYVHDTRNITWGSKAR